MNPQIAPDLYAMGVAILLITCALRAGFSLTWLGTVATLALLLAIAGASAGLIVFLMVP